MSRSKKACAALALGAALLLGGVGSAASAGAVAGPGAVRAVTPQSNVPALDAPGPAKPVSFPPDGQWHSPGRVTIQAPPHTRITGADWSCSGLSCPVTLAPDGSSAVVDVQGSAIWLRAWTVYVAAKDDAPLAGGSYSGSLTFEGVTVPLDVTITPGTPGAFGGYASNVPGGGGARVLFVDPASNAAAAGFTVNDVIVSVDGQPVTSSSSLNAVLASKRAGATVPVGIRRSGALMTLQYAVDQ